MRHLEMGISKPSLFTGLDPRFTLGLPKSTGSDIMHLGALNLSDLMISLWRGTMDCTRPDSKANWPWLVLQGDIWQQHGKAVADALYYLPSSFECPPHNIAEKITSGVENSHSNVRIVARVRQTAQADAQLSPTAFSGITVLTSRLGIQAHGSPS